MFDESFQGYGIILYQKIGELTIWFDNCGQKNNNKIIIWYILWLVNTGLFYHVTLLFLI